MALRTGSDPRQTAERLRDAGDLDPLIQRVGDARVVCIGEASHGTHEYYAWRALLTPAPDRREGLRPGRGGR